MKRQIMVALEEETIQALQKLATKYGRSKFIREAVKEKLENEKNTN